jgi:hypothetical protein
MTGPTADARPRPETLRLYGAPDYLEPDPDDVRALVDLLAMTADEIARLTGFRDGRAVRRWLAPVGTRTHAPCPYAAWRLILQAAGLAKAAKPLRLPKAIRSQRPIMKSAAKR